MISRWLKVCVLWLGAVLLLGQAVTAAQFSVSTNAGDEFVSLGRDTNGTVWLAGARNGVATLFQATGMNFNAATLAALNVEDDVYALSISRDARLVCGISGDEATLWNVATPGIVTGLGFPIGQSFSEAHGVSSGSDPIVVGFSGTSSFIWNQASGIQASPSDLPHAGIRLTGIDGSGQIVIGFGSSPISSADPIVYQNGGYTFLKENDVGNSVPTSSALCVSPDGNDIGGRINNQGAIWRKGTNWQDSLPLLLSINSNPVPEVLAVTDTGFAVGTTAGGGYVHNPHTGVTSWFDDWWQNETGNVVPHHVTGVNDVYEAAGQIYFALTTTSGAALASVNTPPPPAPSLSIASLPSGQIELRWPTNQSCTVETTLALAAPPAWTPLTNAVPLLTNSQFVLILPVTNTASYYRLRCP